MPICSGFFVGIRHTVIVSGSKVVTGCLRVFNNILLRNGIKAVVTQVGCFIREANESFEEISNVSCVYSESRRIEKQFPKQMDTHLGFPDLQSKSQN